MGQCTSSNPQSANEVRVWKNGVTLLQSSSPIPDSYPIVVGNL